MSMQRAPCPAVTRFSRARPTLTLVLPPDSPSLNTLHQTKLVYDQLLADKHEKLLSVLMTRKNQYDSQIGTLSASDGDKAMEFGVRAQEAVNKLSEELSEELNAVRRDYQGKLNKMTEAMVGTGS